MRAATAATAPSTEAHASEDTIHRMVSAQRGSAGAIGQQGSFQPADVQALGAVHFAALQRELMQSASRQLGVSQHGVSHHHHHHHQGVHHAHWSAAGAHAVAQVGAMQAAAQVQAGVAAVQQAQQGMHHPHHAAQMQHGFPPPTFLGPYGECSV